MLLYPVIAVIVLVFSGLLGMAGLGAAILCVPFFFYLGVPLNEAAAARFFMNAISLRPPCADGQWRAALHSLLGVRKVESG